MKNYLTILIVILFAVGLKAQDFGINFSGFVKTDVFYDTRQVENAREGHFLLYPKNEALDANGDDINGNPEFNILSIQSRLTGKITAPDALGAKVSGLLEGAFFGSTNATINTLRLRHAFVKLAWENTSIIAGQTWHPFFQTDDYPAVVSFNTGVPFQPFSRNPQIRITQKLDPLELSLTLLAQRDFASTGPGGAQSDYLRDAGIPNVNFGVKANAGKHVFGAGVDFMTLRPITSIISDDGDLFAVDENITSISFQGFFKLNFDKLQIKAQAFYGQNAYHMMMLGGYAVKAGDYAPGEIEYTPYETLSAWAELIYGEKLQVGLFAGYSENLGTPDDIAGSAAFGKVIYARGADIESVLRLSPRVQYDAGKFRFAFELEATGATYDISTGNNDMVLNIRPLVACFLFF